MSSAIKPIPAFYAVYVLRSTVRHASLYIGSTPNPPRRLKQHNGEVKGGARRTARRAYRPWEMVSIVSGFPSTVAALKFEWALNNPHLSLHIPAESRLTVSTQRKANGMPRRPVRTLNSVMANMNLLTGVPSFARWPLKLHFFREEAHAAWESRSKTTGEPLRRGLEILTDFKPLRGAEEEEDDDDEKEEDEGDEKETPTGIHALTLDYSSMGDYVEKAQNLVSGERLGKCVHCSEELEAGKGLYPLCSNGDCEAMGHLDCWSRHSLGSDVESHGDRTAVIPNECSCPSCGSKMRWGDMMTELSLRVRGQDEVEKLLKKRQRARKKK